MQEEEVSNIMRDQETLCVCAPFFVFLFFLRVLNSFFQSDAVYQGVQLEEKGGGKYQRVAAPQPPAISVFFLQFLPPPPFSRIVSAPPSTRFTPFFGRSTLRIMFLVRGAPSCETHLAANEHELATSDAVRTGLGTY